MKRSNRSIENVAMHSISNHCKIGCGCVKKYSLTLLYGFLGWKRKQCVVLVSAVGGWLTRKASSSCNIKEIA